MYINKHIPRTHMAVGMMFEVISRIGHTYAIWDGNKFYYIRHKYWQEFMDSADHYDAHDVYGIIQPISEERFVGIDVSKYKEILLKQTNDPEAILKLEESREKIFFDLRLKRNA